MRPFVNKVTSNVKGFDGMWEAELGRHTLIVGPNRSNKTTIIQGLELGLTGIVDELMGRDEVKLAKLLSSLKPADQEALRASIELSNGRKGGFYMEAGSRASADNIVPEAMIHRVVRNALSGSNAKMVDAMVDWMDADGVTIDYIVDQLPKDHQAKYQDIADNMRRREKNEITILRKICDYAGKRQREYSSQAKNHEDFASNLADQVEQIRSASTIHKKIVDCVDEHKSAIDHLVSAAEWADENGVDQCPTCGSQVGNAHISVAHAHLKEQAIAPSKEEMEKLVYNITSIMSDSVRWNIAIKQKKKAGEARRYAEQYKDLKKCCTELLKRIVLEAFSEFKHKVNRYLPEDWNLDYNEELECVGLNQGDRGIFTSLSGAEWATVVTAVACAAGDTRDKDEPIVLVIEDRAWDPKTLSSVMKQLQKFNGQVVIQSTVKPRGRISSEWTVIESEKFVRKNKGIEEPVKKSKRIPKTRKNLLDALGFSADDIALMNDQTSKELSDRGLPATNIKIEDDGSWSVVGA